MDRRFEIAHKSTILIVDDEPLARDLMKALLADKGYSLSFASNGEEALAKAAKLAPDLILLDVMMPGMDGFEVCRRLRADPLLSTVPVVMVTALHDHNSLSRGIEAGADDFVSKPFDHAELQARVRTIIRLNRYRLLREQAKFERLVELSPDGIVIVGTEGIIHLANPAISRMLGVKREKDVIGKELLAFVAPEQTDYCAAYLHDAIAGTSQVAPIETWFVRSNGERFPVAITAGRFAWDEEPAAQIIVRDITERKQAEKALRQYADEQAALYAVASAAATILDPDELLSAVLDAVLSAMKTDAGWVTLTESISGEPPRIVAWRGVPQSFIDAKATIPLRNCPISERLSVNADAQIEPIPMAECHVLPPETRTSTDLHSHIGIPLSTGDEILGVLYVAWRTPPPYSELDHTLLTTIGQQVGLALHNARLYYAARQVDRLRVLNELDKTLAATLDPEEVAEITLHQTSAALDAPVGALFVLPPQINTHLEQAFILGQGWIKIEASEQDMQRLHAFQRRLQQNGHEIISLSDDELAVISGRHCIAERWGSVGIVAPIWSDTNLIAMLALGGRPADRPFTDEERALAQTAASRAGQAIQSARLYRASQQQSAHLSTLHAISTAAVSSLELDTVLRQVLELTCQALDAPSGSIWMLDPDTERLTFVLTLADEIRDLRGQRLRLGQGIAGWVAQHGQPVRVNDAQHDPRWYDGVDAVTGLETRSLLCAPLKHHGAITGVIEIVNKREGTFTDEDLSLLEAVSSIATAALENARLYMTMRAHAAELALLNEIGLALTSTLDFSTVVYAALSQIQRLFQADYVSLLQPDPHTGELCFVKALIGRRPVEIPVRLPPGEGIVGWVLKRRQPVLIDDVRADPRSLEWVYQHIGTQARSLMAVPLLAREYDIGVIEVSSGEPGAYSNSELHSLQAIASTLSIALENASLYDELKTLLHEQEQTQAHLVHAERMTAIGRLAASIAHEINNPLQAVQTYLTLTQEELDSDRRPEKMNRYLDTVGEEIERIATIVRRMRDFYRPAREGMEAIYLHAVLESVLELTNKQLQHSNVNVERAWTNYLPEIQANPDHLKQVFLNLVLNGVDAMPAGGTLHIATALDQIQVGNDQKLLPAVRIEFSDTGEGMSPEALSHLFEPFFTTKERGSGLGLSISYGIIQSHNGQLTVESHVGLGTTFTILLPVEQPFKG